MSRAALAAARARVAASDEGNGAIDAEDETEATDTDDSLSMREQIVGIVIEALRKQGYPTLTRETVVSDDDHRRAFIDMLGDCRPLPVVRQLIEDARLRRL